MGDIKPVSLRTVQAAALFISCTLSGASLGLSVFVIPRVLESPPALMVQQWERTFDNGRHILLSASQAAAAAYFYLAYCFGMSAGAAGKLYFLAGILCVGCIPYTLAVIMPTNRKLLLKVEELGRLGAEKELVETGPKEERAEYLVSRWGLFNLGRAALFVTACLAGLAATV
ncbi:hypothetical protein GQ53DRAFT_663765 [Thozetella sp. PMI_491]|nr:hypothetical protein GQ53DRAFT_663765 [Thozetella sp. PMI_491]